MAVSIPEDPAGLDLELERQLFDTTIEQVKKIGASSSLPESTGDLFNASELGLEEIDTGFLQRMLDLANLEIEIGSQDRPQTKAIALALMKIRKSMDLTDSEAKLLLTLKPKRLPHRLDLRGMILPGVDLREAHLLGLDLSNARVADDISLVSAKVSERVDLSGTTAAQATLGGIMAKSVSFGSLVAQHLSFTHCCVVEVRAFGGNFPTIAVRSLELIGSTIGTFRTCPATHPEFHVTTSHTSDPSLNGEWIHQRANGTTIVLSAPYTNASAILRGSYK